MGFDKMTDEARKEAGRKGGQRSWRKKRERRSGGFISSTAAAAAGKAGAEARKSRAVKQAERIFNLRQALRLYQAFPEAQAALAVDDRLAEEQT